MWPPVSDHCYGRPANKLATGEVPSLRTPPPTTAKTHILFVDDEPSMLRVLKMGMRSMNEVWEMDFVGGGEEALALMGQKNFDVIVTDMRMPGVNGTQLLNHVMRHQPNAIRIVLSGYSDLSEVVNCVGLTHQFLEKPCSLDQLKNCLKRITQAKANIANDQLCHLSSSLKNLPSLPELYMEIADALQSPSATTQRIGEIASKDPAISAKLLQLANSAFFGFSRKVFSVSEAVQLLGVNVIQSLSMVVPIFSSFHREKCPAFPLDEIWEHSIQTAVLARRIGSQYLDDSLLEEQSFCAGILHDIGKIILADGLPGEYSHVLREARETNMPVLEVERRHFRATHAEVGGYLLSLWGLPIPLVEAVANHHHPGRCNTQDVCLGGIVHVANALQHLESGSSSLVPSPLDKEYLNFVGLSESFESWRAEAAAKSSESA